jgi:hypothetical protein
VIPKKITINNGKDMGFSDQGGQNHFEMTVPAKNFSILAIQHGVTSS